MEITKGQELWHSKVFRLLNSAVCFTLAFTILTYTQWMVMALVGMVYKFDAIIYYFGIRFIYHEWNKKTVTLIFGAGTLYPLFFGLACLYIYDKLREHKFVLNLFFLWGFVCGTAVFCAQSVTAALGAGEYNSPFYTNMGAVFAWWNLPHFANYVVNLPFFALLIYFAVNYARPFIMFSYSYSKVNKVDRRRNYFFETAFLPFLIGAALCIYITFPNNVWIHLVQIGVLFLALCITWYALFYVDVMKDDVLRYKSLQKPAYILAIALVMYFIYINYTMGELHIGAGG